MMMRRRMIRMRVIKPPPMYIRSLLPSDPGTGRSIPGPAAVARR
jgi:hypothetical protein